MKVHHACGLAVLIGAALGAAAVSGLHAQSKPPVYFISEIEITNPEAYAKEYLPKVAALNKAFGGRSLIRTSGKITPIDGELPKTRITVSAWDSLEKIRAWHDSAEFKELRKTGDQYAKFRSYAVEGVAD